VKVLLTLSAIAEKEGIDASPEEVQAEIDEQLARYGNDPRLAESLGSRRGRSYLRMTIRNRKLVDTLIDRALGTDASAAPAASSASEEVEPEPEHIQE
jgi:FKBP-type peptidyl-prolyl cis-trans isomerase (trigger factor)